MPMIEGKKFPYTQAGIAAAKELCIAYGAYLEVRKSAKERAAAAAYSISSAAGRRWRKCSAAR